MQGGKRILLVLHIDSVFPYPGPRFRQFHTSQVHTASPYIRRHPFTGFQLACQHLFRVERESPKSQMCWGPWRSSDPGPGAPSVPVGELHLGEKWFALHFCFRLPKKSVAFLGTTEAPRQALASRVEHLEKAGCPPTARGLLCSWESSILKQSFLFRVPHIAKSPASMATPGTWERGGKVRIVRAFQRQAIGLCLCRKALEAEATSRHEEWGGDGSTRELLRALHLRKQSLIAPSSVLCL